MFCSYRHSFLASSATRPAPEDLILTHIFGWTPPVGFEVLFSPRLPRASYQGTASAVPTGGKQNGGFSRVEGKESGAKAQDQNRAFFGTAEAVP
jgi:hypothetical protein